MRKESDSKIQKYWSWQEFNLRIAGNKFKVQQQFVNNITYQAMGPSQNNTKSVLQ